MRFKKRAFTIIELMVVVAIIGVLAGIATVSYDNSQKKSRDSRRIADFDALKTAILLYKDDHGSIPPSPCNGGGAFCTIPAFTTCAPSGDPNYNANCSTTVLSELTTGKYIDKIPQDPLSPSQGYNYYKNTAGNLIAGLESYSGTAPYNNSFKVSGGIDSGHQYCNSDIVSNSYCIVINL